MVNGLYDCTRRLVFQSKLSNNENKLTYVPCCSIAVEKEKELCMDDRKAPIVYLHKIKFIAGVETRMCE